MTHTATSGQHTATSGQHTGSARPAAIVALLLLIAGGLYLAVFKVADARARHAFNAGWRPPSSVALTAGRTYQISVRGGADALRARQADPTAPRCTWSADSSARQPLQVSPLGADSGALNVVGTFVAPAGGPLHIECAPWGPVSVDDADDSSVDLPGVFVLLSAVTLTAGIALGVGLAYDRGAGRR